MENNEKKIKYHSIARVFFDILRDINSTKYSMTKFSALIGLSLFTIICLAGIYIMILKNEVDYILVGEIMTFTLTLSGFKNFGKKDSNPVQEPNETKKLIVENVENIDLRG